jgi:ribonuclease HI
MVSDPPQDGSSAPDLVEIWTDGSCRPNPGPGGWAALLRWRGHERTLSGAEAESTNNRMELTAACAALEALKRPSRVRLHTDSEYLKKGITEWLPAWQRRGWRTAGGETVANRDLWERLLAAAAAHRIEWHWIKGHAGTAENERVDRLANEARAALAQPRREG